MTAPRRRWFSFSLRTLFVVVTALCGLFAHELRWIVERREYIAMLRSRPEFNRNGTTGNLPPHMEPTDARGILWLFGESGWSLVWVPVNAESITVVGPVGGGGIIEESDPAMATAMRLFPEADLRPYCLSCGDPDAFMYFAAIKTTPMKSAPAR